MTRLPLAVAATAAITLLAAVPARAKSLGWPEVAVEAALDADGTARVAERIVHRFDGAWQGGVQTRALDGLESLTDVELLEDGRPYAEGGVATKGHFAVTRSADAVEIRWRSRDDDEPPYADAIRSFTLRYRVRGLVLPAGERDEIYWKALFADREAPVEAASVSVRLPAPADPAALDLAFYTDAAEARWEVLDGRIVRFTAREVPPGDRFEVRIGVPSGVFDRGRLPAPPPSRAWAVVSGLLLALGLPAGTAVTMRRRHRRLGVDGTAAAPSTDWSVYEPDLPPAVMGLLLDEAAGADEVSATLVDLARRGYVRLDGVKAFSIERLREADADLLPYEREVLSALFAGDEGPRSRVTRDDLKDRFYRALPAIEAEIAAEATRRGLFPANPALARRRYLLAGLSLVLAGGVVALAAAGPVLPAAIAAGIGLAILVRRRREPEQLLGSAALGLVMLAVLALVEGLGWLSGLGLGIAGSGAVLAGFAHFVPRRTARGVGERARWQAFLSDLGALDGLAPAQAERLLPYAIAGGVKRRGVVRLACALRGPVGWYASNGPRRRAARALSGGAVTAESGWGATGGRSGGGGASRAVHAPALGAGLAGLTSSLGSTLGSRPARSGRGSSGGGGGRGGGGGGGW